MKYRLLAILILLMQMGFAQTNLVPNPSFEIITNCPSSTGQIFLALPWFSGNQSTPDCYNVCASDVDVKIPCNQFGCQNAKSGFGYAGILIYDKNNNDFEYIESALTSELIKDSVYCIQFFVNLNDTLNFASNNIGVCLSEDSIQVLGDNQIVIHTALTNPFIISDKINWVEISFYYIANGGEQYIAIGNFNTFNQEEQFLDSQYYPQAYYYIDDVSVTECNIPDIEAITKPNVFTPNGDGYNDTFVIQSLPPNSQLTIYNRWGNEVYTTTNYQNNWDGDGISDGVYFYVLTLPSGNLTKGTITILRNN